MYTTQDPHLSITYKNGLKMHCGHRNHLQLPENEQYDRLSTQLISGKLVQDPTKLLLPALNYSTNCATIVYQAHNNTKNDYTFNHVFKTMTASEITPLQIICEVERTPIGTCFAMAVKMPQLAGLPSTQK